MKRDEVLYLGHQFPYRILWVCKARTVCKGGAELTLSGASDTPACSRCGADHSGVIDEIQKREERLGDEAPIRGATPPKSRRINAKRTRPLILRTPPGATTTSPRVVWRTNETYNSPLCGLGNSSD